MQGVACEELLAKHAYRSSSANSAHYEMGRIVIRLDAPWHPPVGRMVDLARPFHAYRFMRSHLIEIFSKTIKLSLLRPQTARRWDRCFLLQRAVHPLVYAILLGLARLYQFRIDAKLDEPHRQLGKTCESVRGERCAVVHSNTIGKPVGPENVPEMLERLLQ